MQTHILVTSCNNTNELHCGPVGCQVARNTNFCKIEHEHAETDNFIVFFLFSMFQILCLSVYTLYNGLFTALCMWQDMQILFQQNKKTLL